MQTLYIEGSSIEDNNLKVINPFSLADKHFVVEEEVDGIDISISFTETAEISINHDESFKCVHLSKWTKEHINKLFDLAHDRYVVYGKWCHDKRAIFYDNLCDFFVETNIFDKKDKIWLSTPQRQSLIRNAAGDLICSAPILKIGKLSGKDEIETLTSLSSFCKTDKWKNRLLNYCSIKDINFYKVLAETTDNMFMKGIVFKHENELNIIEQYKFIRQDYVDIMAKRKNNLVIQNMIVHSK